MIGMCLLGFLAVANVGYCQWRSGQGNGGFPEYGPSRFGSNYGGGSGGFGQYSFLNSANPDQVEYFMEIERSPVLTKGEKRAKEDQWAAQQGGSVAAAYNQYQADVANAKAQFMSRRQPFVAQLSPGAQIAIGQLDGISTNPGLTDRQINQQEQQLIDALTDSVRREVLSVGGIGRDFQR